MSEKIVQCRYCKQKFENLNDLSHIGECAQMHKILDVLYKNKVFNFVEDEEDE